MSRKLVVVTVVSFLLGSGITYLVLNTKINQERSYRKEIGSMCAKVIGASVGVSRTCGEAYTTLVNCLDNKICDRAGLEALNKEKDSYEHQLDQLSNNIFLLQKNYK